MSARSTLRTLPPKLLPQKEVIEMMRDKIAAIIWDNTNDNDIDCDHIAYKILAVLPRWQPIKTAPKDGVMILVCLPRMMKLIIRARFDRVHGYWISDYEGEGGIKRHYSLHPSDLWQPMPDLPL